MEMKKGFTFIEMLVVIAIVAIMAALLVPALARASEAAAAATCQDNIHKIGLAISSWRNDHDRAWFVIPESPGLGHWSDQRQACQVIAFVMESCRSLQHGLRWLRPAAGPACCVGLHRRCCAPASPASPSLHAVPSLGLGPTRQPC
jgi:prepilin-type N-terminal cleavage/methylation domain-containing protein